MYDNAVTQNSELLQKRLSLYEKHNPALFVHEDLLSSKDPAVSETAHISRGECGHVHPDVSDNTLLMVALSGKPIHFIPCLVDFDPAPTLFT